MKLLAIWFGKLSLVLTRVLRFGSGTTFPGLLAERIDRNIIRKLAREIKYGSIVITGTNGKTTTAKMLTEILSQEGFSVLHNPAGSNLTRGIASALIHSTNLFGTQMAADIAVFEIDEATMSEATTKIRPKIVLVTNLFRDQLDRYGELDNTAAIIGNSLRGFPELSVILNADDPLVASLSRYAEGEILYFGIEDQNMSTESKSAVDSKDCLECGHEYEYENRYFGHLGVWRCPNCGASRPKPDFTAGDINLTPQSSRFTINLPKEALKVEMQISGLYNIYNALAAASVASVATIKGPAMTEALKNFSAAFGRMERLEVEGKTLELLLIKNPTGANQSLATVYGSSEPKSILFALNDNFADGTDVSWIWDIDFESFDFSKDSIVVSGIRAQDMALRLKYAGIDAKKIKVENDLGKAVHGLLESTPKGKTCYVLPTYTAMIEIRNTWGNKEDELSELGKVTKHGI